MRSLYKSWVLLTNTTFSESHLFHSCPAGLWLCLFHKPLDCAGLPPRSWVLLGSLQPLPGSCLAEVHDWVVGPELSIPLLAISNHLSNISPLSALQEFPFGNFTILLPEYLAENHSESKQYVLDFPSGSVAKTLCPRYRGSGFDPWSVN